MHSDLYSTIEFNIIPLRLHLVFDVDIRDSPLCPIVLCIAPIISRTDSKISTERLPAPNAKAAKHRDRRKSSNLLQLPAFPQSPESVIKSPGPL